MCGGVSGVGPRADSPRLGRLVLLAVGIAFVLAGAGSFWLDLDTQVNPGGPQSSAGPCPVSPFYQPVTHVEELMVGTALLCGGVLSLVG